MSTDQHGRGRKTATRGESTQTAANRWNEPEPVPRADSSNPPANGLSRLEDRKTDRLYQNVLFFRSNIPEKNGRPNKIRSITFLPRTSKIKIQTQKKNGDSEIVEFPPCPRDQHQTSPTSDHKEGVPLPLPYVTSLSKSTHPPRTNRSVLRTRIYLTPRENTSTTKVPRNEKCHEWPTCLPLAIP